jgi:hypothetical protein
MIPAAGFTSDYLNPPKPAIDKELCSLDQSPCIEGQHINSIGIAA